MFYKNDWLSWSYDGVKFGNKLSPQSKFELQFKKTVNHPLKSHKEELLENTRTIRDSVSEPFDLLLSGGLDSEIILRCNIELGIPINVFIFKYENNYNHFDVQHALRLCNELNVSPKVIDFNLEKFFKNDAYDIWTKTYVKASGRLPAMKMIEYLDNIPIIGETPPTWNFVNNKWLFEFSEVDFCQAIYTNVINRPMISDWYGYSPEVIMSHALLPGIQALITSTSPPPVIEQYDSSRYAFAYYNNLKYDLYKKIWPDILIRPKRNGFEKFYLGNDARNVLPLPEFQKKYIDYLGCTNTICNFNMQQLFNLCSLDYS